MLVSRVGVKLDEGHLLLKLAVFTVGRKKNNVKSYSPFTSTEYSKTTLQQEVANSQQILTALLSNFNYLNFDYLNTQVLISECVHLLSASSDYQGWTVLVKVSSYL